MTTDKAQQLNDELESIDTIIDAGTREPGYLISSVMDVLRQVIEEVREPAKPGELHTKHTSPKTANPALISMVDPRF